MSTIFWDFDGTLVYSHHLWSGSMFAALTAIDPKTTVSFQQIRECNTRGFTWQTPHKDHTALAGEAWWHHMESHAYTSYLSCGVSQCIAAAAASLLRHFIKRPEQYHLFPDTVNTLTHFQKQGYRQILLSNNYPDLCDILQALNIDLFFDGIILSAVEGYDKPRRELFETAKKRYPDTSYYMVGDNAAADICGAKAANIPSILVHNDIPHPHADYCALSLNDVLDYIISKKVHV